ncbi:MAG: helix-turn-helix domain-containing protein, partial [Polaribacter sp.]|uniref:helix-turn-helix domain-containing protein n=1 Tax=Polaribacter sp. TaxID=1920175 RepID=UPI002F356B3A
KRQLLSLRTIFIISVGLFILILLRQFIVEKKLNTKFEALIIELNKKEKQSHKKRSDLILKDAITEGILLGLERIEENKTFLQSNFDLKYVANKLNSNTSYVSKTINKNKHQSFKDYLNKLRIDFIVVELRNNSKLRRHSLDAIAKDIGYSNGSSFSKIFKKITGINPSYFIDKLNDGN